MNSVNLYCIAVLYLQKCDAEILKVEWRKKHKPPLDMFKKRENYLSKKTKGIGDWENKFAAQKRAF